MKLSIFFILVVIYSLPEFSQAQTEKKLFYSKQWEITTQDSSYYYRVCTLDSVNYQFIGEVKDFLKNGQMVMKGVYKGGEKNGKFISYYSGGQIESEIEFKNNKELGVWKYYFPNGKLAKEITFIDGDFFVNASYDESGNALVKNGTGEWSFTYDWPELLYSITVTGYFKGGKKEGEWRCVSSKGDLLYTEEFSKDKFKRGILYGTEKKTVYNEEFKNKFLVAYKFDVTERFSFVDFVRRSDYPYLTFLPKPQRVTPTRLDSVDVDGKGMFVIVEKQASYKGGLAAFYEIIGKNIRYPAEARKKRIMGKVMVEFTINIDGSISDVKVVSGIGGGCDEEAVRVVSLTGPWNPGMQRGKPVKTKFVTPINFRLN